MSTTVDQRVVEMRFDNRHFEKNVSTTMSSLDKLKQKLNFTGAAKGMENVGNAVKKVDMNGLARGVETVRASFSALDVIGVTALANITNSAINAGKRIVHALTLEPVMSGFQEYETKINAIQTIMSNTASKGTTMEDVTRVIGELNTYADKTIYNFAEMTRNIGTFTAAGVGLEESAAAIQGIANLAAASGSNSQQASTAMYQLSQALAAGTVKLMDWNSVVNAGMGGEKFQEALKSTAREMGIGVDSMIEKAGSFRDSLQDGWISADVLNTTLQKFTVEGAKAYAESMVTAGKYTREQADALIEEAQSMEDAATKVKTFTQLWDTMKESVQSGWSQTWELIIGNFEEAKEFLTGLSDLFGGIIEGFSNARNNLLGGALMSNWDKLIQKVNAAGIETETFTSKLKETAKENGIAVDDLIKQHGSLAKVMRAGKIPGDIIVKTLKKLIGSETEATKTTKELGDVVNKVIRGDFGNGKDRVDALTKAGYDYATVQNLVNEKLGCSHRLMSTLTEEQVKNADKLAALSDEQLKNKGFTEEQIKALRELKKAADEGGTSINDLINDIARPSGRELLLEGFMNIINSVIDSCKALGKAWREIFPPMQSEQLYNIIEGFNKLTQLIVVDKDAADKLMRTFRGVFAALDVVLTIVGGPVKMAFKALTQILGMFDMDVLDLTARIGDAIYGFRNWLDSTLDFTKVFEKLMPYLINGVETVKEWFAAFKESKAFTNFTNTLCESAEAVKEWFANIDIGDDLVSGLINGIKDGAAGAIKAIVQLGKDILAGLCEVLGINSPSKETFAIGRYLVDGLIDGIQAGVGWVLDAIGFVGTAIVNGFKSLSDKEFASGGAEIVGGIVDGIKSMASSVWDGLSGVISKCVEMIGKADFGSILAAGLSGGMLFTLVKIGKAIEALASPFDGLGDVFEETAGLVKNASKVVKSFSGVLKSFSASIKAEALKKIAISLGILVASIALLTYLDPAKVDAALDVIMNLALTLGALYVVMNRFGKNGPSNLNETVKSFADITKLSGLLLSIGVSLLMLAGAMKILSTISDGDMDRSLKAITGFGVLVGALIMVNKIAGSDIDKVGVTIRKISTAMLLLAIVGKIIATMSWGDMAKAGVGLAGLTIVVGTLIAISKTSGPHMDKVGGTIGKIGLAMLALSVTAKIIASMSWGDMGRAAIGIAGLIGVVAGLVSITKIASDRELKTLGGMLIKMSAAMLILAVVCKILADMTWPDMVKAGAGVTALGLIITGLVAATRLASDKELKRVGSTLLMMSISIGILAGVSMMLSLMSVEGLFKGIIAVGALTTLMSMMVKSTKDANDVKGNLIVMTIAIVALTAAVATLSMIDTAQLAKATGALSAVILSFAFLVKASKSAEGIKMGSLITMVAAIGILAGVVVLLSQIDSNNALPNAAALALLLTSLATSMAILSKAGPMASMAVKPAALMGLVVAELGIVLVGMSHLSDVDSLLPIAKSLSILLLALSAACVVLVPLGATGPLAIQGAGVLVTVLATLGIVAIGLGELMSHIPSEKIEEWKSGINKFMDLLSTLAYGLGEVIGSFVGGFSAGALSGLPQIGQYLSDFMTNAQPFIDAAKTVDGSVLKGAGMISAAIAALSIADMINSMASLVNGDATLATLGTELSSFMTNARPFLDGVKSVDPATLEGVKSLAGAILALTAANVLEGLTSWFAGDVSLADFGKELEAFGPSMKTYASAVAGIDTEAVKASAVAAKTLAEMASTIPNEGGILGKIFGENSVDTFGYQLESFGKSLKAYGVAVTGIAVEPITVSVEAAKALSSMAASIPNMGGVVTFFTGDNDLATFGTQLVSFGRSLSLYSLTVNGLLTEPIYASVDAAKALGQMNAEIPNIGGVVSWFAGDNDLATFGTQIVAFGSSLKTYSLAVTGLAIDPIYNSVEAARALAKLAKILPSDGGFWSWLKDDTVSLSDFGDEIIPFGEDMQTYSNKVAKVNLPAMLSAVTGAQYIANLMKGLVGIDTSGVGPFVTALGTLGTASVDKFVSAFKNANGKLNTVGADMVLAVSVGIQNRIPMLLTLANTSITQLLTQFKSRQALFQVAGIELMSRFINGISSRRTSLSSITSAILSGALSNIRGYYMRFYTAGSYVVSGFANGITANTYRAEAAAAAMAKAAHEAAMDAIGAHSPARKFIEVGKFADMGLAKGLTDYAYMARSASSGVGNDILSAIQNYLGIHSPSRVMRDEVGQYVVLGIAEGIKSNMSAEEAAAQKAKNIANAFKEELSELTLDAETLNLEHQLWSNTEGLNASDSEKQAKEAEKISKQLALQTERVQLADAEYRITMEEFGETATATQEAYNKLLEEKIKTSTLAAQADKLIEAEFQASKDALRAYSKWMAENATNLLKMGLSMDSIDSAARSETGYSGGGINNQRAREVVEYWADSTYAEVKKQCQDISYKSWSEISKASVDGLTNGLIKGTSGVTQAATQLANKVTQAAKTTLGIHSPSREFYTIGSHVVMGFINALNDGHDQITKSAADGFGDAISIITNAFDTDMDIQPTISPVLDLSNIQNGANQIDGLFAHRTLALAGVNAGYINDNSNTMSGLIDHMQKLNAESNSKVVDAIGTLRGDFGALVNAIGSMHIRMDSGTVVGELIGKIDSSLGQIATHKGRG